MSLLASDLGGNMCVNEQSTTKCGYEKGGIKGLYDSRGVWESFFFLARVFPIVRELIFTVVV